VRGRGLILAILAAPALLAGCAIPSAATVRLSEAGPAGASRASPIAALALSGPPVGRFVEVNPQTRQPTGAEALMRRIGPDSDGAWRLTLAWKSARPGAHLRPAQEIDGDTGQDGALRIVRIADARSGRSASFEPALLTAPAQLDAEPQTQSVVVVLSDEDGARRLRARHTIESAGLELIETPAGIYWAERVHLNAAASLGPVSARRTMAVWLAPGAGVVAQYQADTLLVLGIPAGTREMLLLAAPLERGSPEQSPVETD
jgi:hypothetical protein